VTGYGETGQELVTGGVDEVFFTGSPANGRKVMRAAADGPTPVVLELGGKDPMIVCDDADLKRAVDAAMLGVFTSGGQMCVSAERLYVFDGIYDRFVQEVSERVAALRQGPAPTEEPLGSVDVGAMTMPRQLRIIQELVDDAVDRGARVLAGGRRNPHYDGQFYEPTILVDVDHSMRIMHEEHFGPVMVICRVQSESEAIRLSNASAYGLGSSVFTRDRKRALRMAQQLRAGMTVANDYGLAYMMQALPFGGVGESGFGRINGREGLRACCYAKAIVTDRLPFGKSVAIHPIREATYPIVTGAMRVLYGKGLGQKTRAAVDLARRLTGS
jgi:acyl-CoA reductase-like NAD-dependent aldehyde dehydrogenase